MKPLFAFATLSLSLAAAGQAATPAAEAPIRTMIAAFNKGDVALAKSTHAASPQIVDEVAAPFAWAGATAFDDWIGVLGRTEAAEGKTGGKVWLGRATRATVSGDRAYYVLPSTYTFQQKGHTMRETGTMTFVLTREGEAWKIAAWTWSSPVAARIK